ncbi:leucyl/phenylalanyl-tRNA--protein transferase [Zunongwangia profunda SM-A87]|uniref:Leucyl/phenylalanyl-tRNA--protein transferase n=1 Tax=Zunongwangia profunda (strain DSM 18752 / CCTCC AB 206139 / SM-A87) TaxID=655815 RepID=D5BCC2_ZUNPS|nr:leucyl/phenylalanyl-tRNA--protein transferase [Zunongwangia profunda]ADF54748.1 leucyl/phenylalanyl-tRNA--protein transferase [Zunongwangia profunda SM-A87]
MLQILNPFEPFPDIRYTSDDGLLAVGGSLTESRLMEAYSKGIFPWYDESQPILWWCPDPRMVLFPHKLKVSKSMKQLFKKKAFKITYNEAFETVIENCAKIKRKGQLGTWITPEMKAAYIGLNKKGIAQSVEVWKDGEIVGGLYGIYLKNKKLFCGESMFAKVSNASKYGFISMVRKLQENGVKLIDCQVHTDHLESLGAEEISRKEFLEYL